MRISQKRRFTALLAGLSGLGIAVALTFSPLSAQGPGGPAGVQLKIRAQNRSVIDTPFCGVGAGLVGDRLDVDAFMDMNGVVTGSARFEDALGQVTYIPIDTMFSFGQGLLAQDLISQDTVAIWIHKLLLPGSVALINVELPRGCYNTKSTFTPGVDKVTTEISFR